MALPVVVLAQYAAEDAKAATTTTTTTTTSTVPTTTTSTPPGPAAFRVARAVVSSPSTTVPASTPAGNDVTGMASWYPEAPPGYCASPTLPFGTVVTVTDLVSGASVSCTVDDRQAYTPGRVVDLSEEGFSQLAPLSQGLAVVRVRW